MKQSRIALAVETLNDVQLWLEEQGYRVGDDVPEVTDGFEIERAVRKALQDIESAAAHSSDDLDMAMLAGVSLSNVSLSLETDRANKAEERASKAEQAHAKMTVYAEHLEGKMKRMMERCIEGFQAIRSSNLERGHAAADEMVKILKDEMEDS